VSNSKLATYTLLSPNCTKPRNAKIDTITPHCVAGNLSIESTLKLFVPKERKASCNYAIGTDGRIGLGVDEANRSWCSSSASNDNRAITVEIANDGGAPDWHMSDAAIEAFIRLSVDICTRYGFKGVYYDPDKTAPHRNNGYMRITLHRWFANKDCPGNYFISKIPYVVGEINKRMTATQQHEPKPTQAVFSPYTVRVTADSLNIRSGPGTNHTVVGVIKDKGIYTIVEQAFGTGAILWGKLKSGAGWIALDYTVIVNTDSPTQAVFSPYLVKITTDPLNIRSGPGTNYSIVGTIKGKGVYTIVEEKTGTGAKLWGKLKSGVGWISLDYTKKV
jgi:uncharacterized protein YraI